MTGLVPGAAPVPPQVEQAASLVRLTVVVTPLHGVVEGQVQLGFEVLTPPGPGAAAAPAAATAVAVAEDAAEQIGEVVGRGRWRRIRAHRLPRPRAPAKGLAAGPSRRTSSYSLRLAGVAEHVVGGRDLLEAILGARVGVGVVLLGQLAVGARDLLLGRRVRHAENLVVVLLEPLPLGSHGPQPLTFTMAGLRTRPFQR